MASILEAIFVTFVMAGMFFALSRAWYSPEVVVFLSLLLVWNVGILSDAEALSGFNNPSMLVIGGLFVAVAAIENSGLAEKAASRVLGLETTFSSGFLRLMVCAAAASAFVNNTPVVALLIPVTRDWARTRGFDPAALLMPLSFACAFGGMLTTVGGGTNLVIQGLLYEAGKTEEGVAPFRLFEPSWVGLPLVVVGVSYLLVAAPRLLAPGNSGGGGGVGVGGGGGLRGGGDAEGRSSGRDRSEDVTTEVEVSEDFELVGQPFALVLATLGLPMDTLIKVRRRYHSGGVTSRGGKPLAPIGNPDPDGSDGGGTGDGDGGDGAAINDLSDEGDEESNGLSWAGRIGTGVAALARRPALGDVGGIGLVALRRRPAWYQRLEGGDSGERSPRFADAEEACIEMPAMRTSPVGDAAVADGSGTPATEGASCASSGGAALDYSRGAVSFDDICGVSPKASVRPGDVLVLCCSREAMVRAICSAASRRGEGLKVLGVGAANFPRHGTVFLELVLSRSSHNFLGRTPRLDNAYFAAVYGCVVVAFRLKGTMGFGGGGGGDDVRDRIDSGNGRHSVNNVGSPAVGMGRTGCEATADAEGATTTTTTTTTPTVTSESDTPLVTSRDSSSPSVGSPLPYPPVTPGSPLQYYPVVRSPVSAASPPVSMASPPLLASHSSPLMGAGPPEGAGLGARRRRGEVLAPGDVVVVLATEGFLEEASSKREFLREGRVGRLPEPTGWFHYFPLLIFAAMLAWVLAIGVDMIRAVFAACAVIILGGWVDARRAVGHVNWGLLLLIGSALGFSKGVSNSGLAEYAAVAIRKSGMGPSASVYVLFGFTMLCTELISNNAAAALNIPIALSMAREMEVDYKPFAMAVLVAASSSFLTPIGTPTNTLVWAPGGYKFYDYARLGAPLSIVFWLVGCAAIPWLFPF